MQDEHADECQHCDWQIVEETKPVAGPWNCAAEHRTMESPESNSRSSPEPWQWSDIEEEEDPDGLADGDTDVTLEEHFDEPPGRETSHDTSIITSSAT